MKDNVMTLNITSWILGIVIFAIGVLNLVLVHPVPGLVFLILSLLYIPQTDAQLRGKLGFSIPLAIKIILGLVSIWFTLGVSDLGDMLDKL
ncbi:hypothetical protein [Pontibacter roseus]|uniref:hypothetical protein n=1 Tax=Pontibacter roseus TaxID=336989 RepID=UPI00036BDD0F|nr:hypothetical protein [Pontibacter roseus]